MADIKKRLDILIYERGLAPSRENAKSLIMSGIVFVNSQKIDKPGTLIAEEAPIEIHNNNQKKYTSRGGFKLEKAIEEFNINLSGVIAADIGASTGGFTDCLLKYGAKKVYAVDVGYGQLDWGLRNDYRVINIERKNARYLTEYEIIDKLDFFCVDVSFISLKLIIPTLLRLSGSDVSAVCLIKPQFEAGKENVGKNGVVRDKLIHSSILKSLCEFFTVSGLNIKGITFSPIKGPKGNIEFLAYLNRGEPIPLSTDIDEIVDAAHSQLNSK